MNMFKCVICDADVSKPKSFAFKGGRACRTHEEVAQDAKIRLEAQREAQSTPAKPRHATWQDTSASTARLECKCFSCRTRAVKKQEWAQEMLLSMAVARANSEKSNVLNAEDPVHQRVRTAFGVTPENPLVIVDVYDVSDFSPAKVTALVKGNRDLQMVCQFTGVALLCEPCAKKFGLGGHPGPTFDQIMAVAPAAELLINDLAAAMR